jgi:hypothetical protein
MRKILITGFLGLVLFPELAASEDTPQKPEKEPDIVRFNQIARQIDGKVGQARASGSVLAEVQAMQALEAEYAGREEALGVLRALLAQRLPLVGDYAGAHRSLDLAHGRPSGQSSPPLFGVPEGYAPVDAIEAIAAAAGPRQVVMINEAHHVPQHRAFTLQLLYALRKQGFTYFAAEAFSHDPQLSERGYPTRATGSYVSEPVFGDLVRTALRLGYKTVPYEAESHEIGGRERDQAKHLVERILAKDPKARVLVHAGHGHISERPGRYKMMAAELREMTGIDPFTINQEWMTEHSAPEHEHPIYRWATERGLVDRPVVFRNGAGDFWSLSNSSDVALFHPRSRSEHGRPHWLRMGGLRSPFPLSEDVCGLAFLLSEGTSSQAPACLVKARPAREGADAIPIDQIAVEAGKPVPALMLPEGEHVIRVEDAKGKVIKEWTAAGARSSG